MIHELEPATAVFIAVGYVGFVVTYLLEVTPSGRASRAGQSMNYLMVVFILCAITSYAVQFLPHSWQWTRQIEGWILAVAAIGLLASGCGVRLARAMNYESVLKENDALKARIVELEK